MRNGLPRHHASGRETLRHLLRGCSSTWKQLLNPPDRGSQETSSAVPMSWPQGRASLRRAPSLGGGPRPNTSSYPGCCSPRSRCPGCRAARPIALLQAQAVCFFCKPRRNSRGETSPLTGTYVEKRVIQSSLDGRQENEFPQEDDWGSSHTRKLLQRIHQPSD